MLFGVIMVCCWKAFGWQLMYTYICRLIAAAAAAAAAPAVAAALTYTINMHLAVA